MEKNFYKFFAWWESEKEELWLNEMADRGWELLSCGIFKYTFREDPDELYYVRTQSLSYPYGSEKRREYIRFMEETGAEVIEDNSSKIYFKRKRSLGEFEIFSDHKNRIRQLRNYILYILPIMLSNAVAAFLNYGIYFNSHNPRKYTFYGASINALIALWLLYAMIKMFIKRHKLVQELKEQRIFEE
ncbi:MAG: DUF2812 domain-containing protein [Peptostreptococcaceae bacterium]|nr:DUF2812 domain-containing protein [Peptostreptococcaceae bacterium]